MNRHRKFQRIATLAACAGTTAALAALGSAGSAFATVTCRAPGYASGSSFQSSAQKEIFLLETGWGAHSNCTTKPTASTLTYTATSSGEGLEEFGNTTGKFIPERDKVAFESATGTKDVAGQVLDWYVGTDDAPNPRELGEAAVAAGTLHNQKAEITIPIGQAPVSVILSLPEKCEIQEGSLVDLNNTTLPQLFEAKAAKTTSDPGGIQEQNGYKINTWGAFFSQFGYAKITSGTPGALQFLDEGGATGCEQEIKAQVRKTSSGTSFAFKSYLAQINPSVWSGFAADAPSWPDAPVFTEDLKTGGTENLQSGSGGNLVKNAAANPGSVGYANAADAAKASNGGFGKEAKVSEFSTGAEGTKSPAHQIVWAEMQNNGLSTEGAEYRDPVVGGNVGNCETTKILPAEEGFPYSYTDSWFGLLASDPNISESGGAGDYSICALTYDLVFHHYSNKHLYGGTGTTAEEVAATVRDLFEYITGPGQSDVQSHDYTRYPTGFQSHVALAVNPGIGK